MEEKKQNKAKRVNLAENGVLNEQYTMDNWFVKVKPVFNASLTPPGEVGSNNRFSYERPSVIFSFVQKGKQGKGFDVYMDMDRFDLWADDILDIAHTLKKSILADKANKVTKPTEYIYTTGNNGSKNVGICASSLSNGFASIYGSSIVEGKKVYAYVPVDYTWLRITAKWFKRVTAPWFQSMAEITRKNMVCNWSRYDDSDNEIDPANNFHSPKASESTPCASNMAQEAPKATNAESVPSEKPKAQNEANTVSQPTDRIEISTTSKVIYFGEKGNCSFKGCTKKNKELAFVVTPENASNMGNEWSKFKQLGLEKDHIHVFVTSILLKDGNRLVKKVELAS